VGGGLSNSSPSTHVKYNRSVTGHIYTPTYTGMYKSRHVYNQCMMSQCT
jgi:hypothetical protein